MLKPARLDIKDSGILFNNSDSKQLFYSTELIQMMGRYTLVLNNEIFNPGGRSLYAERPFLWEMVENNLELSSYCNQSIYYDDEEFVINTSHYKMSNGAHVTDNHTHFSRNYTINHPWSAVYKTMIPTPRGKLDFAILLNATVGVAGQLFELTCKTVGAALSAPFYYAIFAATDNRKSWAMRTLAGIAAVLPGLPLLAVAQAPFWAANISKYTRHVLDATANLATSAVSWMGRQLGFATKKYTPAKEAAKRLGYNMLKLLPAAAILIASVFTGGISNLALGVMSAIKATAAAVTAAAGVTGTAAVALTTTTAFTVAASTAAIPQAITAGSGFLATNSEKIGFLGRTSRWFKSLFWAPEVKIAPQASNVAGVTKSHKYQSTDAALVKPLLLSAANSPNSTPSSPGAATRNVDEVQSSESLMQAQKDLQQSASLEPDAPQNNRYSRGRGT